MQEADAEYAATNYRAALKAGYYDLQAARDVYRAACETMHVDLVFHFIRVQCVLLAPFCPHTTEYLWGLLNVWTFLILFLLRVVCEWVGRCGR